MRTLFLALAFILNSSGEVSVVDLSKEKNLKTSTIEELAREFFDLAMSPVRITLSIKDRDSLEIAVAKLGENKQRLQDLAEILEARPVPKAAKRKNIDEFLMKKSMALKRSIGKESKQHLHLMADDLKAVWNSSQKAFFRDIQNIDAFKKYFGEDKKETK